MPDVLSMALFERGGQTLVTRRKAGAAPFAGQWLLPCALVAAEESAEEALERHAFRELGVEISAPAFVETLYLEDGGRRYVANIFRVPQPRGNVRFRAAGDYEDARWLSKDELSIVAAPAKLRDWLCGPRKRVSQAGPVPVPAAGEAPDNRRGWNTISRAYQEQKRIPTDRLVYGPRCPDEDQLGLLGDVSGLRVIVLGCGGGQDCIALARRGAQVVGIDLSDRQIEYGRRLAEREGVLVTLLQGSVEVLNGIDDETQDAAVSIYALLFVERVERALAEAFRVLKAGAPFVFSVNHPIDSCLEDRPPYGVTKGYWEREFDWQWDFPDAGVSARLREWHRPVSEWFDLLRGAGFRVQRILEPPPLNDDASAVEDGSDPEKMQLVPRTLIMKAVKP